MTTPTIRPVNPDDIDAITAIYGRSVVEETASFELVPPGQDEMLGRLEAILDAGYPFLVAEIGSDLAGFAYASAFRPRPAYRHTVEDTVYVAPQFWRRGVAKGLLSSLIEECRNRGFRQMIGIIGGEGHAASIRLHESLGFEKVGQMKKVGFKHDRWLDTIYTQLEL